MLIERDDLVVFTDFSLNKIIALVGKGAWENAEGLLLKIERGLGMAPIFEDGLILYPEKLNLVPLVLILIRGLDA